MISLTHLEFTQCKPDKICHSIPEDVADGFIQALRFALNRVTVIA